MDGCSGVQDSPSQERPRSRAGRIATTAENAVVSHLVRRALDWCLTKVGRVVDHVLDGDGATGSEPDETGDDDAGE